MGVAGSAKRVALTFRFPKKGQPYADALRAVGLEPLPFQPGSGASSLDGLAGLVLSGGVDIEPARYGAATDPRTETPDQERDEMEWRLLEQAVAADIPVLAICRGLQLFNVFHEGGTLLQHLDGHTVISPDPSDPAHSVVQAPRSRLASILGLGPVPVNSRHHQVVEQVGRGLLVTSRSDDGVIEGLERPDLRFAVAVQWHPEDQVSRFAAQRRLFEAFAAAL
ncbi:MAG: gamma-glutamyl-gamma-aminobutyrate hydrolase family protein [Candidatus Solibacter sp.]